MALCPSFAKWAELSLLLLQDTDAAGVVPEHQQLVLVYQQGGGVATGDEVPVVLAR